MALVDALGNLIRFVLTHEAAAGEPRQKAEAIVIYNPGGAGVLFRRRRKFWLLCLGEGRDF
jgi:hypothetical protein